MGPSYLAEAEWLAIEPYLQEGGKESVGLITHKDRKLARQIYEAKQHLGALGMIEVALALSRRLPDPSEAFCPGTGQPARAWAVEECPICKGAIPTCAEPFFPEHWAAKGNEQEKIAPWMRPNDRGEKPGEICCLRSTKGRCYDHDPDNYPKFHSGSMAAGRRDSGVP